MKINKTTIKWIALAVGVLALSVSIAVGAAEHKHRRSLEKQVAEQSAVIDTLIKRNQQPMLDVELYVTDKSKNIIYGRYNKGYINMPHERKYILEVDSCSIVSLK